MADDQNITEIAQDGATLPASTHAPTPLVDPAVDLSAATITPIADDPPADDTPHTPTEAEAADLGRPLEAGEIITDSSVGSTGVFASPTSAVDREALDRQLEANEQRQARTRRYLRAIYRREFDELHPNTIEALKRLEVAEAEWDRSLKNFEGQYLKSLDLLDENACAQAEAVRALMEL